MKTRLGIVGAGAIGCVVGGLLTKAGHDVTLIDQWPEHVETMRRRGLRLTGTCGDHTIAVSALHLHEAQSIVEPFELLFIAVKSYDTEWATRLGLQYLSDDGVVVDFQNGINDHRVAAIAGAHRTLGCVITIGAGMYEPGVAMRTDSGRLGFKIGEHDGRDTERAPLAGLSGLGTAECRTEPGARRIAIHLGAEVIGVGRASGFEVEPPMGIAAQRYVDAAEGRGLEEVEADLGRDATSRAGGRPSMLQDVMRGRRTEIDHLNGFVVEEGRRLGVKTPFNEQIVTLYRARGSRLSPDPANLEPLLEMLP
ncbi:MAG: hypothetical protein DMD85_12450 [Candidatus Rokuibacteriota bacterium]|nr:MAG: hypothetical protein DMD85_12450 [Candidatus Rokubacteria bacterium]